MKTTYRRVAQLGSATGLGPVGQRPSKAWVKGSNPLGRAIKSLINQYFITKKWYFLSIYSL